MSTATVWDRRHLPLALTVTATAAASLLILRAAWGPRRRNQPPGKRWFIPFVGEMPAFIDNPVEYAWTRYRRYNSTIFTSHIFGVKSYVCGDVEAVRGVLASSENVDSVIPISTFDQIVSLYNTRGDRHRIFRKHMGLSLSPGHIKVNLAHFTSLIEGKISAWVSGSKEGGSHTICLDDSMRNLILEIGLGPIMGLKVAKDQIAELLELVTVVQAGLFAAPIYFPGTIWYKAINTRPKYMTALKALLLQRFPPHPETQALRLAEDRGGAPGIDTTRALMQEFQECKDPATVDSMAERMVQNMLGATETSHGMAWATLVVLACRPDVQEKIREEQAALITSSGREVTWEALQNGMPYTDACVREAARLVPSAHGVFRKAKKDLKVCGYDIPKDSPIIILLDLLTAKDTAASEAAQLAQKKAAQGSGPDPRATAQADISIGGASSKGMSASEVSQDEDAALGLGSSTMPLAMDYHALQHSYKPERWLTEHKPRHLHVFSHGAHYCLGKDLAIMEIKLIVTYLARQCRWAMDPPTEPRLCFLPFVRLIGGKPAYLKLSPAPL